jgi:thiol-disulfide isomerase/thioredoxin
LVLSSRLVFRRRPVQSATLFLAAWLAAGVAAQEDSFDSKMKDADTLMARRQFEDALRIYKDANALKDKKSIPAHIGMIKAYQGLKAHKSAADTCTDALKHAVDNKPAEAMLRNLRGVSLFSLGDKPDDKRYKQAEEDFRAVLAITDEYPLARFNLGVTLLKQKRDDEGIRELNVFLERAGPPAETALAKKYVENPRRARENYAPDFSFTTLAGEFLTSEDLIGKVVLIDFWATWCPPCVAATPGLKKIQAKFKDEPFTILGVSADRSQGPWKAFVEEHKLSWPQVYDERRSMASRFQVNSYPTYILIDAEGIIQFRHLGWNPGVDGMIEGEARSLIRKARQTAVKQP